MASDFENDHVATERDQLLPWVELRSISDYYGPFRLDPPESSDLERGPGWWKYYSELLELDLHQQQHQLAKRVGSILSNRYFYVGRLVVDHDF